MKGRERRAAEVTVRWSGSDTILLSFAGYVTGAELAPVLAELRSMLAERKPRFLLFDASDVSSYAADVRAPGAELLTITKGANAELAIAVAPNPLVRMIAASLSLVTGMGLTFVDTRAEAERRIREAR